MASYATCRHACICVQYMLFVVKSAVMAIIVTVVVQLKVQVGGTYGVHTVLPA